MDNFKIYNNILAFDAYVRKNIAINIPSVHRDIRIRLLDETYNLVRNLYFAVCTKGNVRMKHITEILVTMGLLDYLFTNIREVSNVNKKHLDTAINKLADIRNMTIAWKKNEEKN